MSATVALRPPCSPPTGVEGLVAHRLGLGDVDALIGLFEAMSPGARHMRFFAPMPVVQRSTVRWLCDVDQQDHRAWLIRELGPEGPVVAEVRGVRHAQRRDVAEVALAVRDDWTGHGLGGALLDWIGADLATAGVTTISYEIHPDNRRSRRLFAKKGGTTRFSDGSFVGEAPVPGRGVVIPDAPACCSVPFTAG